ncbi:MAG: J domain-containing protein [Vicinamibacterales bacterium]
MKTHYELLSIEPGADADTIKKAFRREIARYHPDKVVHLGPEFQEMAATRAAELTVAYKTLTDPRMREEYDASVAGFGPPPAVSQAPPSQSPVAPPAPPVEAPPADEDAYTPPQPTGKRLFESERAGRDLILKRAIAGRVRGSVEAVFGPVETPAVRGFDAALVPVAKPRFLGSHPPRVLVSAIGVVDATAVADAWQAAARSRVHAGKSPVVVLLFGTHLSPRRELLKAMESAARQRQPAEAPGELVVVAVNSGDWTYLMPDDVSETVRNLVGKICVYH